MNGNGEWGSVDLDLWIADHRAELVAYFVEQRRVDPTRADALVTDVLLRALARQGWFESERRVLVWCQMVGDDFLRRGVRREETLAFLTEQQVAALQARAEGLDDAALAARLRVPVARVPDLLRRARDAAERIEEDLSYRP